MRKVIYNSQRNNYDFSGSFSAWSQCFSTCAWMFISYFDNSYDALDDNELSKYFDEVEATVGQPGIAEKVILKCKWITGKTSLWWAVQQTAIQQYLPHKYIRFDAEHNIDMILDIIKHSPIIIGTNKIGGLPDGHIVLLVDYDGDSKSFLVNDPFGNARSNYRDYNGDSILYNFDWLRKFINYGNNTCRIIYGT